MAHVYPHMKHNLVVLSTELLRQVFCMLSPIDVHNLRLVCKKFLQFVDDDGNRVWNAVIQQRDPTMPPVPRHMTPSQYFNLACTFECSVCKFPSAGVIIWEEATRYCCDCKFAKRSEYVEHVGGPYGERLKDLVPWSWIDNALRPWSREDVHVASYFEVTKMYNRSLIDLLLLETSGMDEDQFQTWHKTKRQDQERVDQEVEAFIQWTRERVRRAFRQDVGRVRAELMFSQIDFESATPHNIDVTLDDFMAHPITVGVIEAHRDLTPKDRAGARALLESLYEQSADIANDGPIARTKELVRSIHDAYSTKTNLEGDSSSSDPTQFVDISDYEQCRSFLSLNAITLHCTSCGQSGWYPHALSHRCRERGNGLCLPSDVAALGDAEDPAHKPIPRWISGAPHDRLSPLHFRSKRTPEPRAYPLAISAPIPTEHVTIFNRPVDGTRLVPGVTDPRDFEEVYSPFIECALKYKPYVARPPAPSATFVHSHYKKAAETTRLCGLNPLEASQYDMAQVVVECKTCASLSMENEDYSPVDAPGSHFFDRPYFQDRSQKQAKGFKVFMTGQRAILHLAQNPTHKHGASQIFRAVPPEERFLPLIDIDALSKAELEKGSNWGIRCALCSRTSKDLDEALDHLQRSHGAPRSMESVSIVATKANSLGRMTGFVAPILVQLVVSTSFNT